MEPVAVQVQSAQICGGLKRFPYCHDLHILNVFTTPASIPVNFVQQILHPCHWLWHQVRIQRQGPTNCCCW